MRRALLLLAVSCGGGGGQNDYGGALMTGAMAVGAAGINRAATKECWATCAFGTRCDHASGTCVALACSARCGADMRCEHVGGEDTCVSGPSGAFGPSSMRDAPGEKRDAGADDAGGL